MTVLAAPFRIGALARAAFKPFARDADPGRPGRLLDATRPQRPRRQARREEGHRRDEQALHAGGGREAARLRAADPARLGAGRQVLPDLATPNGWRARRRTRASSRSRTRAPSSRSISPQRLADEIAAFVAASTEAKRANCAFLFRNVQVFRPIGGRRFVNAPYRTESSCPRRSSTRIGPRSTMARRLDEAFAGCEQWTLAPPTQRRSEAVFSPRASSSSRISGRAAAVRTQEPRRAVVVGIVQEDDVAGAMPALERRAIDSAVARRSQSLPQRDQRPVASHAAARPAERRAEDPVGRPVVGDRLAAGVLDRRSRPFGVLEERARRSAAAGCGGGGSAARPGGRRRRSRRPAPVGARPARRRGRRLPWRRLAQGLEHRRRALRVRAVIEGEGDAVDPSWRRIIPSSGRDAAARPAPGRAAIRRAVVRGRSARQFPLRARCLLAAGVGAAESRRRSCPCRSGCGPRAAWRPPCKGLRGQSP